MLEILPNILRVAILLATLIHILIRMRREIMPMGKYGYKSTPKKKAPVKKKKKKGKKK
jgi:hypothetical protein